MRYTAEEIDKKLARGESRTDWERVRALTHEEIEASIDFEDEGEFDLSKATAELPQPLAKRQLTVRLDGDIIEWFRESGKGYQTRMNQVLRSYVEARKREELERRRRERAEVAASGE